jgi:serine/threonine-protein kinase
VSAQIPDSASLVVKPEVKSRVLWVFIAVILVLLLAFGYVLMKRGVRPPALVEQTVTQVIVPTLTGLTEEEAKLELEKAGLKVGTVTKKVPLEEAPLGTKIGTVVRTTPKEGDEIAAGSPVTLEIARPPSPDAVEEVTQVPNLTGLKEKDAEAVLRKAALDISVVSGPSLKSRKGLVFMQSPAAGREVAVNTVVVVVVSTGKPADTKRVTIPDVFGLPVAEATQALQKLGLVVTLSVEIETASGSVATQMPAAGKKVPKGSVVILGIDAQ